MSRNHHWRINLEFLSHFSWRCVWSCHRKWHQEHNTQLSEPYYMTWQCCELIYMEVRYWPLDNKPSDRLKRRLMHITSMKIFISKHTQVPRWWRRRFTFCPPPAGGWRDADAERDEIWTDRVKIASGPREDRGSGPCPLPSALPVVWVDGSELRPGQWRTSGPDNTDVWRWTHGQHQKRYSSQPRPCLNSPLRKDRREDPVPVRLQGERMRNQYRSNERLLD